MSLPYSFTKLVGFPLILAHEGVVDRLGLNQVNVRVAKRKVGTLIRRTTQALLPNCSTVAMACWSSPYSGDRTMVKCIEYSQDAAVPLYRDTFFYFVDATSFWI